MTNDIEGADHTIKVYNVAKSDETFVHDFLLSSKNRVPEQYSDYLEKSMFGIIYYGWLLGKFGPENGQKMYIGITK